MLSSRCISPAYPKPHTRWQRRAALTEVMSNQEPARTAARRARSTIVAVVLIVSATLLGDLGYQSLVAPSSSATPSIAAEAPGRRPPHDGREQDRRTTARDEGAPTLANLDSDLLRALREARTDAASEGIKVNVTSGWRSRTDQERLFQEAVSKYGSAAEAARWVARPGTSAHESGDAVDIAPSAAASWLSRHGATFGLCRIYRNEPWHFELRPSAVDHGCPSVYADPTHDPRMQR